MVSLRRIILYLLMILAVLFSVLPLVWMVISAIKPESQIPTYPPRWIPSVVTFENFLSVISKHNFGRWMLNSIIVASIATLITIVIDAMAGYALARLDFGGRNFLFSLIVSMLLVPIPVTVIPLFLFFSKIHLLDTHIALILPTTANITGVFIMRQFFLGIPGELEDAARIDGCSPFKIWSQIVLPLSGPSLSAVATLTFVSSWNNFLWPLIAINSDNSRTLPVGIAQYMGAMSGASGSAPNYGPPLASAVMATVPTLIVFFALQRYFVQGVSFTGIKG